MRTIVSPATGRLTALLAAPIADDLARAEKVYHDALAPGHAGIRKLVERVGAYRGKRLRPILLLLTARACGRVTPTHHILAAVVEMVHTATLVHDDVLDGADTRRHLPTVNAEWGNQASVLLGDLLFTRAFHLASTTGDATACRLIGEATNAVCAGELRQVYERGNLHLTEADYFACIDGKTAALTACCCRLGAHFAGADAELIERLSGYGRALGLAFQIADDLLDLTGQEESTGKTLGTDLAQQKLTLPMIAMLERLPAEDAARARRQLRTANRDWLLPLLHETGAIAYATRKAYEQIEHARDALTDLPLSESRTVLEQLCDWAVRREA